MLGLRFCVRAFSSCGEWGPLTIAASLVAEHRLQTLRLSSCGSRAQLLRGIWDLPRPGLEPVSPALAGRFSTTAPPGKPCPVLMRHQEKSPSQPLVKPRRGSLVDVVRPVYRSQYRTLRGQRKAGTHVTRLKFNLLGYKLLHQVAGFL